MNPDAAALALATIEVDVSSIEPGMSLTVKWRGKPVFIRNRTPEEIEAAKGVPLSDLKDPAARNDNLPPDALATDENRAAPGKENWLVRSASAPISAACRSASRVPTAAGSARATARSTTPPAASARGRRRRTCSMPKYEFTPTRRS